MTLTPSFLPEGSTLFLRLLFLVWIVSGSIACSNPQRSTISNSERPNVLLVVIDSLRTDALSCYGYHRKTSPFMDQFASESILFRNAISIATSTPPAMAAIMTSRMPYHEPGSRWKIWYGMKRFARSDSESGLPSSLDTFAEILNRNGYATAGFITNPYVRGEFRFDQGFDTYRELFSPGAIVPYGVAEQVTGEAMQWLDHNRGGPFFLYLHFMDVHYPYLPPNEYRGRFSYRRVENESDESLQQIWRKNEGLSNPEHANIEEHMRGLYDEETTYNDYWIGQLLDYLDANHLADNTIVVITSDHGEEFLEHGGTLHGAIPYEELIRVPLMIRAPGYGHQEIDALVRNFDVMPTVLDLAGIESADEDYDAVSLRPLLDGAVETLGLIGMTNYPSSGRLGIKSRLQAIRTDEYKFIYLPDQENSSELYHLIEDPSERTNVYSSEKANVRKALKRQLTATFEKFEMESHIVLRGIHDTLTFDALHRFGGIVAVGDATVTYLEDREEVILNSTGTDPEIILPPMPFDEGKSLLLRLDYWSPASTTLELFYTEYSRKNAPPPPAIKRRVSPGRNIFNISIRAPRGTEQLHIVPGRSVGRYQIESIEVTEVETRPILRNRSAIDESAQGRIALDAEGRNPNGDDSLTLDEITLEQLRAIGYID